MNDRLRGAKVLSDPRLEEWYDCWRLKRHPADRHILKFVREHRATLDILIAALEDPNDSIRDILGSSPCQ